MPELSTFPDRLSAPFRRRPRRRRLFTATQTKAAGQKWIVHAKSDQDIPQKILRQGEAELGWIGGAGW